MHTPKYQSKISMFCSGIYYMGKKEKQIGKKGEPPTTMNNHNDNGNKN